MKSDFYEDYLSRFKSKCGYFDELETDFSYFYIEPDTDDFDQMAYEFLLQDGFRRSRSLYYKNDCPHCKKCLAIRIDPNKFVATKSQRACLKKNSDIKVVLCQTREKFCTDEKIMLYQKYNKKHGNDLSFEAASSELASFTKGYSATWNMEYYLDDVLIAVGVIDYTVNTDKEYASLSSTYFYYLHEGELAKRSLGVFSVLQEIELCKKLGFKWYYLGYYIADCNKMSYKGNYKPHELLIDGKWQACE